MRVCDGFRSNRDVGAAKADKCNPGFVARWRFLSLAGGGGGGGAYILNIYSDDSNALGLG